MLFTAGCAGPNDGVGAPGAVGVRVIWPERAGEVGSALVPAASNSLCIEVWREGVMLDGCSAVIARPDTEARIDGVPAGAAVLRATAHPSSDGTGVAQAMAETAIEVTPGAYGQWGLTLATTITSVGVLPQTAEISVGERVTLTATAHDAAGDAVLVPDVAAFTWTLMSGAECVALDAATREITGVSPGTAVIRATENESGISGETTVTVAALPITYELDTSWGTYGTGAGEFDMPLGIAAAAGGAVCVADVNNSRVQMFTAAGDYISMWGSWGDDDGQFRGPLDVAVGPLGNIYVIDELRATVQKFTAAGIFVCGWGSPGSGSGQFDHPSAVAVDGAGNVYVADTGNDRVQSFDSSGQFLRQWGSVGSEAGEFAGPSGIATDADCNVYVTDPGNYRVQKFTETGSFVCQWGGRGSGDGQFERPGTVASGADGAVFVTDADNRNIQRFTPEGIFVCRLSNQQMQCPDGVAVDENGNVYVADGIANRIYKFRQAP